MTLIFRINKKFYKKLFNHVFYLLKIKILKILSFLKLKFNIQMKKMQDKTCKLINNNNLYIKKKFKTNVK
jgi:hypothetical protein